MKRSVFLSIAIPSIIIALISYGTISWLVYTNQISMTRKAALNTLTTLSQQYTNDPNLFENITWSSNLRLTFINSSGNVLFDSVYSGNLNNHQDRPEFIDAIESGSGESHRYSETLQQVTYYYSSLLVDGNVLRISFTSASLLAQFSTSLSTMLLIFIFIICCSLLLANLLSKLILAPIHRLDLNNPLNNKTYPELVPLLEKMEEHNQLRQEFTSNVSHELKTPLTSIQGYAEIMANNLQGDNTQEFSNKILQESHRLLALIQDILRLSRLDEGKIELSLENIHYFSLIQQSCLSLSTMSKKNQISIQIIGDTEATGQGYPLIMTEIISNLIQNAIKYNQVGGKVLIHCQDQEHAIVISVQDNGIGIPSEDQGRIFERFYRSDKSRNSLIEGTGLGLAIVKHGVEFHHGDISLESEFGQGTTITIKIPKLQKNEIKKEL
ncbi:MAG: sensor histidine kinase [Anaerorhabdus sp.]